MVGILDANLNRTRGREARVLEPTRCLVLDVMDYFDIPRRQLRLRGGLDAAGLRDGPQYGPEPPAHRGPTPRNQGAPQQPWLSVRRLNDVQKLMILRASAIGKSSPIQPLVSLARSAEERRVSKDRNLLEAQDPLDHLMIVAEGLIRAETEGPPQDRRRLRPGERRPRALRLRRDPRPDAARGPSAQPDPVHPLRGAVGRDGGSLRALSERVHLLGQRA